MMYCCKIFEDAINEECIMLIDNWEDYEVDNIHRKIKRIVEKGYYIIDSYQSEEMCRNNMPAVFNKLAFCCWCGKKLEI